MLTGLRAYVVSNPRRNAQPGARFQGLRAVFSWWNEVKLAMARQSGWIVPLTALPVQLAYPPFEWPLLGWIGLVPLLLLLERSAAGARAWIGWGWGWGLVFHAVQFRWLPHALLDQGGLHWLPFTLLTTFSIATVSLYPAFAIGLSRWLSLRARLSALVTFPALFAIQDALLGFSPLGGQPLTSPASTQIESWLAQVLVPLLGASGLTFAIMLVNAAWSAACLSWMAARARSIRWSWMAAAPLLTIAGSIPPVAPNPNSEDRVVLIVPGNEPVERLARASQAPGVLRNYLAATLAGLDSEPGAKDPELVIWPESAVPGRVEQGRQLADLFEISGTLDVDFLLGSNARDQGRLFNSAYLVAAERFETRRYDKIRLVPFGEYVPASFRPWFGKKLTEGVQDYSAGTGDPLLHWRGLRLGLAICFESTVPAHARQAAQAGAEVLIVLSNDQWLTDSASRQHLRLTALRALEIGRDALVATNGGWSGVVRDGQLAELAAPGSGAFQASFRPAGHVTLWTRGGYAALSALLALWLAGALAWRLRRRRW